MTMVAVSQRVAWDTQSLERRDALDQRWIRFLENCGLAPLLIPNNVSVAQKMAAGRPLVGILLTGGNDLEAYGGDAPERDQTELFLLEFSIRHKIPLLGVCRGMQVIQDFYGVSLSPVEGHVAPVQTIQVNGLPVAVNSFHRWGTTLTRRPLEVWAVSADGVVKAVRHQSLPIQGIMWHPERFEPFRNQDVEWVRDFFAGVKVAV